MAREICKKLSGQRDGPSTTDCSSLANSKPSLELPTLEAYIQDEAHESEGKPKNQKDRSLSQISEYAVLSSTSGSTVASRTSSRHSTDVSDSEVEESSCATVVLELCSCVVFYVPNHVQGSDEERALCKAHSVEVYENGTLCIVGSQAKGCSIVPLDPIAFRVNSDALLIDVRIAREDDPKFLPLLGARLEKGTIARLVADVCQGMLLCEVVRETGLTYLPLERVIEGLRDLERQRHNVELVSYQRQLCSQLMGKQRQRFLGLVQE